MTQPQDHIKRKVFFLKILLWLWRFEFYAFMIFSSPFWVCPDLHLRKRISWGELYILPYTFYYVYFWVLIKHYNKDCTIVLNTNHANRLMRPGIKTSPKDRLELVLGENLDVLLIKKQEPWYSVYATSNYGLLINKFKGECHGIIR